MSGAAGKFKQGLIDWVRKHGDEKMSDVMMRGRMQIMDTTGHTELTWNPGNADEVNVARETFERMTARGYQAFRPGESKGQRGGRITSFDPDIERMILFPQLSGG
jgi:hypothetical protein